MRYRRSIIRQRAQVMNRIQKVLEGANIKLSSVASDVMGASGRAMLEAISQGVEDPERLAAYAKGRLREKKPELQKALQGLVGPHQRRLLQSQLRIITFLDEEVSRMDKEIAERMRPFEETLENLAIRHRLDIDIPKGLPIMNVDIKRVGEVLVNLVENATKYSAEGTNIRITVSTVSDRVIFAVSDQGIGIPVEFQAKVFERFYRAPDPSVQTCPGTGLGLSICKAIISAHGGEMALESQPGQGSKFSFAIPVRQDK